MAPCPNLELFIYHTSLLPTRACPLTQPFSLAWISVVCACHLLCYPTSSHNNSSEFRGAILELIVVSTWEIVHLYCLPHLLFGKKSVQTSGKRSAVTMPRAFSLAEAQTWFSDSHLNPHLSALDVTLYLHYYNSDLPKTVSNSAAYIPFIFVRLLWIQDLTTDYVLYLVVIVSFNLKQFCLLDFHVTDVLIL